MMTLQELGRVFATDKGDTKHAFHGRTYLDVYAHYFDEIRHDVRTVLEIGVWRGESLMMWREYFPAAEVWGLDIDPELPPNTTLGERVQVVTGSQTDPQAIWKVAPGRTLDVVIDDGSHLARHMVASWEALWGRVSRGGIYCIEDTGCTWRDLSIEAAEWPGMDRNEDGTDLGEQRGVIEAWMRERMREMDALVGDVSFVHVWPMQIVMRKS